MSDLTNAIVQGMNARRAQREEDYTNQRRAVVDPRNDLKADQEQSGMNALIGQYGPTAAVANERGQLMGEDQRETAAADTHTAAAGNQVETDQGRAAAHTLAFINGLDAADAKDPTGNAAKTFAQQNQGMFPQMGLTSDDLVLQHVPGMLQDKGKRDSERQVAETILAKGAPEKPNIQVGTGENGKPAFLQVHNDGGNASLSTVAGGTPSPKMFNPTGAPFVMDTAAQKFFDKAHPEKGWQDVPGGAAGLAAINRMKAAGGVIGKVEGTADASDFVAPSAADVRTAASGVVEGRSKEAQIEQSVKDAAGLIGPLSTGFAAGSDKIAGTPAYQLAQALIPIKASLTLGGLADLKAKSKNGASGLGALSDKEGDLLASIEGSLATGQDAGTLRQRLSQLVSVHRNRMAAQETAFKEQFGTTPDEAIKSQPAATSRSGLVSKPTAAAAPASAPKIIKYDAQGNRVQ